MELYLCLLLCLRGLLMLLSGYLYAYRKNIMSLRHRSSSMNVKGTKAKREQLLTRSFQEERFFLIT